MSGRGLVSPDGGRQLLLAVGTGGPRGGGGAGRLSWAGLRPSEERGGVAARSSCPGLGSAQRHHLIVFRAGCGQGLVSVPRCVRTLQPRLFSDCVIRTAHYIPVYKHEAAGVLQLRSLNTPQKHGCALAAL